MAFIFRINEGLIQTLETRGYFLLNYRLEDYICIFAQSFQIASFPRRQILFWHL